jgi:uncharacterized protein (TIGR02996 family)
MSEGPSLLRACWDNPEDDNARLIYADWLKTSGDEDQAEFIRLSVQREKLWEGHPDLLLTQERYDELLLNKEKWLAHLPAPVRAYTQFERGLPTKFFIRKSMLKKNAKELLLATAIHSLHFRRGSLPLAELLKTNVLANVRGLNVEETYSEEEDLRAILQSDQLKELRRLDLTTDIDNESLLCEVLQQPGLSNLQHLNCNNSKGVIVQALSKAKCKFRLRSLRLPRGKGFSYLPVLCSLAALLQLEHLSLPADSPADADLRVFAQSHLRKKLITLDASWWINHRVSLKTLVTAGAWPLLENLNLFYAIIAPSELACLSDSSFPSLRKLSLAYGTSNDASIASLSSVNLPHLRWLALDRLAITDRALDALVRSSWLKQLRWLSLESNKTLTAQGLSRMFQRVSFPDLQYLNLNFVPLADEGVEALAKGNPMPSLRELDLGTCEITEQGAIALANSTCFPQLRRLSLTNNSIKQKGVEALCDSALWLNLRQINLYRCTVPPAFAKTLKQKAHSQLKINMP